MIPQHQAWQEPADITLQRQCTTVAQGQEIIQIAEHPLMAVGGRHTQPQELRDTTTPWMITADRAGGATIHAPGQAVLWMAIRYRERGIGARDLVEALRDTAATTLRNLGCEAVWQEQPVLGLYHDEGKLVNFGITRTRDYYLYGASMNLTIDLAVFDRIWLCGTDVRSCRAQDLVPGPIDLRQVARGWAQSFHDRLMEIQTNEI